MDNRDMIFEIDNEENENELNIDLSKFDQAVIWGTIGRQKQWQDN